jgi:hypothetical protein
LRCWAFFFINGDGSIEAEKRLKRIGIKIIRMGLSIDSQSSGTMPQKLLFSLIITTLLMSACASLTPQAPWNVKEVKTTTYMGRINRSKDYQDLKAYLLRKGLRLAILDQDSDIARGALESLYADGLYYSFTDEDTARHIRERTENLMADVLGGLHGNSEWVVSYCIDFSNGIANIDLGYVKADLYYSLSQMTNAHFNARPHNLQSCQQDPAQTPLYQRKVLLTATFDGSKTNYSVVNPSQPLKDIERFDLTLSDLTYQAAEVILTDNGLLAALIQKTNHLADRPPALQGIDPETICRQIKLEPGSQAFKECLNKLSPH